MGQAAIKHPRAIAIATTTIRTGEALELEYADRTNDLIRVRNEPARWDMGPVVKLQMTMQDEGGAPLHVVDVEMSEFHWSLLRLKQPEGILKWVLQPTVPAMYVAQHWHGDDALEAGRTPFDAVAAVLKGYPSVDDYRRQMRPGGRDDLAQGLPEAGAHSGPFEVQLDDELLQVLVAIYIGDARGLASVMDGNRSADWITQEQWDVARKCIAALHSAECAPAELPELRVYDGQGPADRRACGSEEKTMEFAFDIVMRGAVRVEAETEQAARALLAEKLDAVDTTAVRWNNGKPLKMETSLAGDIMAPALYERDGQPATSEDAAGDSVVELFFDCLDAWEDEEDSVKEEHAELIARMQALATALGRRPPQDRRRPQMRG